MPYVFSLNKFLFSERKQNLWNDRSFTSPFWYNNYFEWMDTAGFCPF